MILDNSGVTQRHAIEGGLASVALLLCFGQHRCGHATVGNGRLARCSVQQ